MNCLPYNNEYKVMNFLYNVKAISLWVWYNVLLIKILTLQDNNIKYKIKVLF